MYPPFSRYKINLIDTKRVFKNMYLTEYKPNLSVVKEYLISDTVYYSGVVRFYLDIKKWNAKSNPYNQPITIQFNKFTQTVSAHYFRLVKWDENWELTSWFYDTAEQELILEFTPAEQE